MNTAYPASWILTIRDALILKEEPFRRLSRQATLRQAIALVAVVGLLIGLVQALVALPGLVHPPTFVASDVIAQVDSAIEDAVRFTEPSPNTQIIIDQIKSGLEQFLPAAQKISEAPTPLPHTFGRLFAWVGQWLSTPFGLLGQWLFISACIMICARLLGGRGGLLPYLAASSLSVVPHLLGAFDFVPWIGGTLALLGGLWGLVIQVKAVQLTHDLSQGRSVAAVILPYVIGIVLAGLLALTILGLIFISAVGR